MSITGAELGDTFDLTATDKKTGINTTLKITVGADYSAKISNTDKVSGKTGDEEKYNGKDHDQYFREVFLNYVER